MGLFFSTHRRSFKVADDPTTARQVVDQMTVADGSGGSLPPGVMAKKVGPGEFRAVSPMAGVAASFDVKPAKGGGSIVTETYRAGSPIPGGAAFANTVHGVATNARDAYFRAKNRS